MATPPLGATREVSFEQSSLTGSGYIDARHADGVCAALVIEWLAGGGDIKRQRPGRGHKTAERIARTQDRTMTGETSKLFEEYGLIRAGGNDIIGTQIATLDDIVDFVCGNIGYCYIAMNKDNSTGHAIGAIRSASYGKIFDPNTNERTFSNLAEFVNLFKIRLRFYGEKAGLNDILCVRLKPMLQINTARATP